MTCSSAVRNFKVCNEKCNLIRYALFALNRSIADSESITSVSCFRATELYWTMFIVTVIYCWTVLMFLEKQKHYLETLSREPLDTMLNFMHLFFAGYVIKAMQLTDVFDRKHKGPRWYIWQYFRRSCVCMLRKGRKQKKVRPTWCQMVRGEKEMSRVQLFSLGCLSMAVWFKQRG